MLSKRTLPSTPATRTSCIPRSTAPSPSSASSGSRPNSRLELEAPGRPRSRLSQDGSRPNSRLGLESGGPSQARLLTLSKPTVRAEFDAKSNAKQTSTFGSSSKLDADKRRPSSRPEMSTIRPSSRPDIGTRPTSRPEMSTATASSRSGLVSKPGWSSRTELDNAKTGVRLGLDKTRSVSRSELDKSRAGSRSELDKTRSVSRSELDKTRLGSRSELDKTRLGSRSELDKSRPSSRSELEKSKLGSRTDIEKTRLGSKIKLSRPNSKPELDKTKSGSKSELDKSRPSSRPELTKSRSGSRSELDGGEHYSATPSHIPIRVSSSETSARISQVPPSLSGAHTTPAGTDPRVQVLQDLEEASNTTQHATPPVTRPLPTSSLSSWQSSAVHGINQSLAASRALTSKIHSKLPTPTRTLARKPSGSDKESAT